MDVVVLGLRRGEGLPLVKKAVILLVGLLVALGAGAAAWKRGWFTLGEGNRTTSSNADGSAGDNGFPQSIDRDVHALGRLEPAGGILTIGAVVGDRVESLKVREGEDIDQGDTIAILASNVLRDLEHQAVEAQISEANGRLQAEEAAAEARIRLAELNLKKAQSSDAEIAAQEKQVALAQSNLELSRKDLGRMEGLSAALVSRQELERQRLLVSKAEAELLAAQAALDSLKESSQFAVEGAEAELAAAKAAKDQVLQSIALESLKKKAEIAKTQAEQSVIKAPSDGTVLRIFTREGEIISNKPILQMADLTDMICVAEVYEGDLPRIRAGDTAEVRSEAFPGGKTVTGTVSRVGGMISTPELRSLDPFAPTDRHVVEVEIRFPAKAIPETARLANLQVEVTIHSTTD
jgi:HlyD family secretion protein